MAVGEDYRDRAGKAECDQKLLTATLDGFGG